jgi:biopolymer transport protein ExbD
MKLTKSRKIHYESGPDMTPLVDVVMVLLIFLMMVGTFVTMERYLVSNLPISEQGEGNVKTDGIPTDTQIEVRIERNSTGDGFIATSGRFRGTDVPTVTAVLNQLRQQFEAAGTPADKVQVLISPTGTVPLKDVISVFEAAVSANFSRIGFTEAR